MNTSSSLMLKRFFCFKTKAVSSVSSKNNKSKVVFLGSPQVSTIVLESLFNAANLPNSPFEVAAIVTQPPSRRNRGRKVLPSQVAEYALDRGFPSHLIFTPEKAGEDAFLTSLRDLQPELCITAAYGNILPRKFLDIPPLGTVNVHPSLLPLYRGAAPVQRALQDGVKETGVSIAFTLRKLDAGPVIAYERMTVDDQIQAPDLLTELFSKGSSVLIHELPSILDGSAADKAQPQDDSKATLAPKIDPEESWLSFDQEASVLHNKVRAFAGWPGTRAKFLVVDEKKSSTEILELKIITTRVCARSNIPNTEEDAITFVNGALVVPCGGTTLLEILEVQLPGKKVVKAAAFWNGLRGQKLKTPSNQGSGFATQMACVSIRVLHRYMDITFEDDSNAFVLPAKKRNGVPDKIENEDNSTAKKFANTQVEKTGDSRGCLRMLNPFYDQQKLLARFVSLNNDSDINKYKEQCEMLLSGQSINSESRILTITAYSYECRAATSRVEDFVFLEQAAATLNMETPNDDMDKEDKKNVEKDFLWTHGTRKDVEQSWTIFVLLLSAKEEKIIGKAICSGWADRAAKRISEN
ncbi:hypothetical protein ACFE04_005570 [Oxalis oulophora]